MRAEKLLVLVEGSNDDLPILPHDGGTQPSSASKSLRNIKKFSDVKVFECPKCGGTEWTTTEAMVEPEPQPKRWQRSYLLQAFSAALVGIRKRYRQLAQFIKKREIDDG
jgi:hypothetical protein